ncbi:glycosyltransferase family 4 protein [Kushneria sp. AK178]
MKVAVVADWLTAYAGAERVIEAIIEIYPQADIYTTVYDAKGMKNSKINNFKVYETFISKLPKAKKWYQKYLPLMPLAIEQLDLSSYDVVISSSHAVAKGVITGPDQLHVCYCHSPIRYAWDFQHQYLREAGMSKGIKSWVARWLLHRIRLWDVRTSNGVDVFIANSKYIARRINKVYGRKASVIYPNVAIDDFQVNQNKEDFYLAASRLVPYKRVDLIVEAFSQMPDKTLVVIGDGPQMESIRAKAGSNVTLMGYQNFDVLKGHMSRAKAFVFAAEEDFGIMPVEVQACGTPVIAYGRGGSLETVVEGQTGTFLHEQTAISICDAVSTFEARQEPWSHETIRKNAERFSTERFQREFKVLIDTHYKDLCNQRGF